MCSALSTWRLEVGYEPCDGVAACPFVDLNPQKLRLGFDPQARTDMQVDRVRESPDARSGIRQIAFRLRLGANC